MEHFLIETIETVTIGFTLPVFPRTTDSKYRWHVAAANEGISKYDGLNVHAHNQGHVIANDDGSLIAYVDAAGSVWYPE